MSKKNEQGPTLSLLFNVCFCRRVWREGEGLFNAKVIGGGDVRVAVGRGVGWRFASQW